MKSYKMNSTQRLFITVNIIFIASPVFGGRSEQTHTVHVCANNRIKPIAENVYDKDEFQSIIIPVVDQQVDDSRNDDDTHATPKVELSNEESKNSKILSILSTGIRTKMYKYNSEDAKIMFYHDKCQFQNVIHVEGNDSIILEAYALANIAHLRVLYGVVNDYEESFKNLITFADPVSYGLTEVFTKDLKFVIKFLSESEFNEYTSMLFAMFSHFCEHPKSFLPKISGLYKLNYNSKFHYITVIFNIYPLKLDKNRIKLYNLSGSDSSISNKEDEQPSDPMKQEFENDWPGGITIPFSNIYEFILQDLKCDFDLLKSWNKMNYSLFVVVIRYNNLHTNPSDPQEIRLMQYVKSSISSTHKGQSHYKNAIVATMNDDRLIIFMGIIDNPLKSTDDASLKDDEKSKSSPQELEDYKNQLMQFITEKVFKTEKTETND